MILKLDVIAHTENIIVLIKAVSKSVVLPQIQQCYILKRAAASHHHSLYPL